MTDQGSPDESSTDKARRLMNVLQAETDPVRQLEILKALVFQGPSPDWLMSLDLEKLLSSGSPDADIRQCDGE